MSNPNSIFEAIKNSPKLNFDNYVELHSGQQTLAPQNYRSMYRDGFVFKQFKDLRDAFGLIEEVRDKDVMGTSELYEKKALAYVDNVNYSDYQTLLNYVNQTNSQNKVTKSVTENILENITTFINLGGLYKKDKLVITQDDRGVFDFGLASLGLYRPIEFYAPELKDDIENGIVKNQYRYTDLAIGVVSGDDVSKIGDSFYYKFGKKQYLCQKRQKGATNVYNEFFEICDLKQNSDGLFITYEKGTNKVFNGKGKNRLKYASSNKKSYLMFEKNEDNVKYVDIFVPVNFYVKSSDAGRALSLLPAFLIASTLEKYGISARISAMRIGSDNNINTTVSIPVKDYEEPSNEAFDRSFKILATSEMASAFFAFFKIIASNEGVQAKPTKDYWDAFSELAHEQQPYMNEMMQRYKNWINENKDKGFVNTKVTNPNFQFAIKQEEYRNVFDGSLTLPSIISKLHDVFYKFYYYMDFLAIEMIPMQKFIKNIYERFSNDDNFLSLFDVPKTTEGKKRVIRDYVLRMLVQKYVIVEGGAYADSKEQIDNKNQMFSSKTKLLDESLNSIG